MRTPANAPAHCLLVALLFALPAPAATPEDVEKAYANCVAYNEKTSIEATPEARKAWAVEQCENARSGSCEKPSGFFCDGWVRLYLEKVKAYEGSDAIDFPH